MTDRIRISADISLDPDELDWRFVRAGGPGGQKVNKTSSAVQLRFDLARSPSLPEPVRARLARLAGRRLAADGVLMIDARRFRTQARNRDDALDRLCALIRAAEAEPRARRPTRVPTAERRRRLADKRRRARLKAARGTGDSDTG